MSVFKIQFNFVLCSFRWLMVLSGINSMDAISWRVTDLNCTLIVSSFSKFSVKFWSVRFCYDIRLSRRCKERIAVLIVWTREIHTSMWFVCPNMGTLNTQTKCTQAEMRFLVVENEWLATTPTRDLYVQNSTSVFVYLFRFCMMLELNCLNFRRLAIGCLVRAFNFINKHCKKGKYRRIDHTKPQKKRLQSILMNENHKIAFKFLSVCVCKRSKQQTWKIMSYSNSSVHNGISEWSAHAIRTLANAKFKRSACVCILEHTTSFYPVTHLMNEFLTIESDWK